MCSSTGGPNDEEDTLPLKSECILMANDSCGKTQRNPTKMAGSQK